MFSVCKKCIVEYLEENTNCPICDTLLHQSHPLLYIAHDRTLQSIVYKLVANLESDEIERQCKYYRENNLELPTQLKEKIELMNKKNGSNSKSSINGDETKGDQKSTKNKDESLPIHKENNYHRDDEPIALSLEPLEGLQVGSFFILKTFYFEFPFKFITSFIFQGVEKQVYNLLVSFDNHACEKIHSPKALFEHRAIQRLGYFVR